MAQPLESWMKTEALLTAVAGGSADPPLMLDPGYAALLEEAREVTKVHPCLRPSANFLHRLRTQPKRMQVTVHPSADTFTIGLPGQAESAPFAAAGSELLAAIEEQSLPPSLLELLDEDTPDELKAPMPFWRGSLVLDLHDLRKGTAGRLGRMVLVHPSQGSLIADANRVAHRTGCSPVEAEAMLLQVVSRPLCLDPDPKVAMVANRIQHHRRLVPTVAVRRLLRRHSRTLAAQAVMRKVGRQTDSHHLPNANFMAFLARRGMQRTAAPVPNPIAGSQLPPLASPMTLDVSRLARALERPRTEVANDSTPRLLDEYILETERAPGWTHVTRLTLRQRPSGEEVLGELYVERDRRDGSTGGTGASCRFVLPSRVLAMRYVHQFTEIFTEEGRKAVRITHRAPGQLARVSCTPALRAARGVVATTAAPAPVPAAPVPTPAPVPAATHMPTPAPVPTPSPAPTLPTRPTNPAICAIVSSLLSSAHQFQQRRDAAAAAAAAANASTQPNTQLQAPETQHLTLASLLAPSAAAKAAPTLALQLGLGIHQPPPPPVPAPAPAPVPKTPPPSQPPTSSLSSPGLSALLAGTPSADHPAPSPPSSLLERLTAPPQAVPQPSPALSLSLPVGITRLMAPRAPSPAPVLAQPASPLLALDAQQLLQLLPGPKVVPAVAPTSSQAPPRRLLTLVPPFTAAAAPPPRPLRRASSEKKRR